MFFSELLMCSNFYYLPFFEHYYLICIFNCT